MYCEEFNQRVSGKENEEINETNNKGNALNLDFMIQRLEH
jgi:hypothetical protein